MSKQEIMRELNRQMGLLVEHQQAEIEKKNQQLKALAKYVKSQRSQLDGMKQQLQADNLVVQPSKIACKFGQQCKNNKRKKCRYSHDTVASQPSLRTLLASATPPQRRDLFGERLLPMVKKCLLKRVGTTELAPKITGMLLEMDNVELLHLLEVKTALAARVDEAVQVLLEHLGKLLSQAKSVSTHSRAPCITPNAHNVSPKTNADARYW